MKLSPSATALLNADPFLPPSDNMEEQEDMRRQTFMKEIHIKVNNLGNLTSDLFQQCMDEDEENAASSLNDDDLVLVSFIEDQEYIDLLDVLYNRWCLFYITKYQQMSEIETLTMVGELEPGTNKDRKVKASLGINVFTEITRLYTLRSKSRIGANQFVSLNDNTLHKSWISIARSFDISEQYEPKEDKDINVETRLARIRSIWDSPILSFTQSEVIMMTFFLTQQINDVVQGQCFDEFKVVFELVWIRCGMLTQEAYTEGVLDDPKMRVQVEVEPEPLFIFNRSFAAFCCFYMGDILRRFYYYDLLRQRACSPEELPPNLPALAGHTKAWLERIIKELPEEAFTDAYTDNADDGYNFPGDDLWFKFYKPKEVPSRALCLMAFRPHLYRRFFSEARTSKQAVLDAVATAHIARLFVLKSIATYVQLKTGGNYEIKWYDGVVINSKDIEGSDYMLQSNQCPLIVQIFSSYCAYDRSQVFMSDNLYEVIAVWFYWLQVRYESQLHGNSFEFFIEKAIGAPAPLRGASATATASTPARNPLRNLRVLL